MRRTSDRQSRIEFGAPLPSPEFDMLVEWDFAQLFTYIQTWSAAREYIKENGDEFLARTHERMLSAWGNPNEKKRIAMDFILLVGKNN